MEISVYQLENVSELQGPVGQRGFNKQGPVGPAGPRGFNGTKGIQGVIGSQGINGSQGPLGPQGPNGAGIFSQCEHKTKKLTGRQAPITSNSLLIPTVILGEPSVSKFKKRRFKTIIDDKVLRAGCPTSLPNLNADEFLSP